MGMLYKNVNKAGTYGGLERCIQGFDGETGRKETTWKI
jgi:hypothetical protein